MSTAATEKFGSDPLSELPRAGIVVRDYIGAQVDQLNRAIARTQRHDPGSVGSTRSAVHRIRTSIRGYRHLFTDAPQGGPQLDHLLDALKRTEDLEGLRCHFADRFDQLDLTVPEYPKWYAVLEADQEASYRNIERISTQTWVAALLGQVRIFADRAECSRDGDRPASSLMGVLSQAKAHLLDTYAKLSFATDLAAARNETRRAARDTRYLAEAVLPALGRAAGEIIIPVSNLEHLLGRYRQAAIARTWLLKLPGADRADSFTSSLADLEREQLRQLADEIDQATSGMIERWR